MNSKFAALLTLCSILNHNYIMISCKLVRFFSLHVNNTRLHNWLACKFIDKGLSLLLWALLQAFVPSSKQHLIWVTNLFGFLLLRFESRLTHSLVGCLLLSNLFCLLHQVFAELHFSQRVVNWMCVEGLLTWWNLILLIVIFNEK